jgi:hypothetical protein
MISKYYIKPIFYALLVLLGFVLGCNLSCNNKKCDEVKPVIINHPPEQTEIHVPTLVLEGGHIPTEVTQTKIDSFIAYEYEPVDTSRITAPLIDKYNKLVSVYNRLQSDWDIKRDYADSANFDAGLVWVNNSTKGNRIISQQFGLKEVPKTVIVPAKKRNQVFIGMGALYNTSTLSLGGGAMFVHKNGRMFEANAYMGTDGRITYQVGTKFKIKLR